MAAMDPQLWAFLLVATLLGGTPGADTLLVARNVLEGSDVSLAEARHGRVKHCVRAGDHVRGEDGIGGMASDDFIHV